jgi:threonine dehydratase
MEHEEMPLDRRLRQEILFARERVYRFGQATPLERLNLPGPGPEIWVKREDLSAVKSYKWRGACNRMAVLSPAEAARGVVTASAGNHAQGVALAARALGIRARIYMPRSTPKVKQTAVRHHGGAQGARRPACRAQRHARRGPPGAQPAGDERAAPPAAGSVRRIRSGRSLRTWPA